MVNENSVFYNTIYSACFVAKEMHSIICFYKNDLENIFDSDIP
jgi:hypothetical protein